MFEILKSRIASRKRYRHTMNELGALSNRELADIGISRSDIQRIAKETAQEAMRRT